MWPCYWGSLINHPIDLVVIKNLILFFLGSIVMRGAGCTINDLIDAPLDLKVKRTKKTTCIRRFVKKGSYIVLNHPIIFWIINCY